jgi:hypothetical protein
MSHSPATKLFELEDQPTTAIGMFSKWKIGALAKECPHPLEMETGHYAQDHKKEYNGHSQNPHTEKGRSNDDTGSTSQRGDPYKTE